MLTKKLHAKKSKEKIPQAVSLTKAEPNFGCKL